MRIVNTLIFLLFFVGCVYAAKEPKAVANTRKSVVSVLTYKDGTLLRSGVGVFAGDKGELFSSYSLFLNADSAVTVDASGVVRQVKRIVSADDIYDCIKARVEWDKKITSLGLSVNAVQKGETLYLVSYGTKKNGTIEELTVSDVNTASSYPYYTFPFPMQERYISTPVVNSNGELVALMQPVTHNDSINSYAVSASFVNSLNTTALTYGVSKYRSIDIPLALPKQQKEALTTLYFLQNGAYSGDALRFLTALNDYNNTFTDNSEGHVMLAEYYVYADTAFDKARKEWAVALSNSDKPGEVYYNISKVFKVAATNLSKTQEESVAYVDSAIIYIEKALEGSKEPLYMLHKAELHHAKGDYATAFENYASITTTNLKNAELYASAANCKNALGEYDAAILYMDSAVACFGSLPVADMAPYIIERGIIKHRAGKAREAVLDYNNYASLRGNNLNARFYFLREQAEYDAKMFQQALDDIEMAIYLMPEEPLFLIEKGRICYRVKLVDEAVSTLLKAKDITEKNPDVHYILARCYMVKGDKNTAKEYMLLAREYGHYDAEAKLKEWAE